MVGLFWEVFGLADKVPAKTQNATAKGATSSSRWCLEKTFIAIIYSAKMGEGLYKFGVLADMLAPEECLGRLVGYSPEILDQVGLIGVTCGMSNPRKIVAR